MKRSERLVDMTKYLMERPHTLISLPFFVKRYGAAKSSISEDLAILKHTLAANQDGILETVAGAAGGVRYVPYLGKNHVKRYLTDLSSRIEDSQRILAGGFVYLSDILDDPQDLRQIGKLIATRYAYSKIDVVMTVETKGISLAQAVARYLNVPFVIARKQSKVTEGATVSVNYISSSIDRVSKMELPTRALKNNSNVLIVDDFMKAGGTLTGMEELTKEFNSNVAGTCVLCEADFDKNKLIEGYLSLVKISRIDTTKRIILAEPGNFVAHTDFSRFQ
ncbi:pur operon repressor [Lactobacillus acetotolerans]|jgi:purine operon repressor|uniref:Pur operon repressor n=1 Tax=Lactobacillus acetotolerans TaxID=1600 RepID=A0A0D6A276_9LACO|nr:pur operon repressor [Lactobacillus acetotolerans]KRN38793.1 pur operon repressor [Lactobacillus acetotolerans DSM 20749 = JCM 3825]MBN7277182.1 pur operon repressor [Lactobacillus acetotolerans]QFG50778.1 pur operon repressor [Lactobacillus acetotolerans]QGV05110.1 pur operon repressor [Lactobacillus acetotolerans]QJD72629.1 pur operon repressor [Lactobacillus acetotolerans]